MEFAPQKRAIRRNGTRRPVQNETDTELEFESTAFNYGFDCPDEFKIVVLRTGVYHLIAAVDFEPHPTGYRTIRIKADGEILSHSTVTSGLPDGNYFANIRFDLTTTAELKKGTVLTLEVRIDDAAPINASNWSLGVALLTAPKCC